MKDCTTCKYGFVDEQFGVPMCHHPLRFSEDCVDFNMHEEIEESEKATGIEEKKLPDGLEEAAKKYKSQWDVEHPHSPDIDFIAGAEWQKVQDQKTIELAEDHAMLAGMNKMEQQMMEGAVEHYVVGEIAGSPVGPAIVHYDESLNIGDKVKVIVIKED